MMPSAEQVIPSEPGNAMSYNVQYLKTRQISETLIFFNNLGNVKYARLVTFCAYS
jgi:hypothetical protein